MEWFGGLQKSLQAAQAQATATAEKARALAQQASIQAKTYAGQATEKAKELAKQAAEEAQLQISQLKQAASGVTTSSSSQVNERDLQYYGVTEGLVEVVSSMTYSTFSDHVDPAASVSTSTSTDSFKLSPWQEKHALLVLTQVEQLQHLRYALCPKRMDEQKFWTIYFSLVKVMLPPQAFGMPEAQPSLSSSKQASASVMDAQVSGGSVGVHGSPAVPGTSSMITASEATAYASSTAIEPASEAAGYGNADLDDSGEKVDMDDYLGLDEADEDLDQDLDGLEDDLELATYLQEALAMDEEQLGSDDLGSVADDELDDYISQLKEEDAGEEEAAVPNGEAAVASR